ncbi:PAS domain-containing hybrid sensor histidine kinase/response regulator [Nodularia spumigena]|uniref:PAS domain-containing hybrid sensor histidine kinase/response regulator n=1 Tax=Nodularia spumigena TaxID=70799 RepID=UPI00232C57A1|nr:PAS domain-containing sensor histidine kinase [Nodularia spumigena]MDB9355898.1 PAS domain S-box protein [Nodularia spumigena CS-587/03]MDB9338450.1 PAS domain S-box protein [Nodularia spumigena CS-589/07]MDB9344909.1 PAS domain S-box protein [Nodularia spumigena CS-588/06]MDB9368591.1 PAS domain S-box protein [Nodularia spumigena CS-586/05]MDB9500868.1 PAS domain S-box protein [Nodularia spumigena CS-336/02]
MMRENLEQAITWAHHRLENLSVRASQTGEQEGYQELLQEAIAEISISLEELHVLAEELTQQNRELVTTRYLVEAERQSYEDLFNFAPDGYLVTDITGVIQEVNYAAAKLFNVRQSYLIGKPLSVFIHHTELPKFRFCIGKLQQQQEQKITAEFRVFHNEGKIDFPAEMTVALTEGNSQQKKAGLRWLFRDISDRLQAQQKIREQAALLDITTDAIFVRDLQNQILYWNKGAEKIYGWRAEEAIGKNTWELLSPEASPQLAVALTTVLKNGSWFGELRKVTRNGKRIVINSRWTLMYDTAGAPRSIMTVDTDITEKKQLEIQLQRAQRLESLATLTSAIAHDLKNILSPMMTVAQLLPLKHPQLSESSLQMLKLLETHTKQGTDLVQQIQSFTSNFEGKGSIVLVSNLIKDIEQTIKNIFPKSIESDMNISSEIEFVRGNQAQLHEVLINLLVNARNAMPQGGKVEISGHKVLIDDSFTKTHIGAKVGEYLVITVSDSGIGMSPELIAKILTPSFTTQEQNKVTGLGLAIDIINSYGGFLEVSSQVGVGSQFQVYLPSSESTPPIVDEIKLPTGNGELILVVDNEAAITQITKTTLEIHNYRVLIAQNGIEALTLYTQYQQDIKLVLIDLMISSMAGGTAIRTLQVINPEVQIIAMSGLASAAALARATVTGIHGFLAKPFTADELLNSIHDVLVAKMIA